MNSFIWTPWCFVNLQSLLSLLLVCKNIKIQDRIEKLLLTFARLVLAISLPFSRCKTYFFPKLTSFQDIEKANIFQIQMPLFFHEYFPMNYLRQEKNLTFQFALFVWYILRYQAFFQRIWRFFGSRERKLGMHLSQMPIPLIPLRSESFFLFYFSDIRGGNSWFEFFLKFIGLFALLLLLKIFYLKRMKKICILHKKFSF